MSVRVDVVVPKLCPDPACLTFLAVVAECEMSNLQIPRVGWGFRSPSFFEVENKASSGQFVGLWRA